MALWHALCISHFNCLFYTRVPFPWGALTYIPTWRREVRALRAGRAPLLTRYTYLLTPIWQAAGVSSPTFAQKMGYHIIIMRNPLTSQEQCKICSRKSSYIHSTCMPCIAHHILRELIQSKPLLLFQKCIRQNWFVYNNMALIKYICTSKVTILKKKISFSTSLAKSTL